MQLQYTFYQLPWPLVHAVSDTLNHLENAGPWDDEDFETVSLRKRITDDKHGLDFIYPNIPVKDWEKLPQSTEHYSIAVNF